MESSPCCGVWFVFLFFFLTAATIAKGQDAQRDVNFKYKFKDFKYKFLYFAFEKLGSHGMQLSQSGRVLAQQGHRVTYLLPSDGPRMPRTSDDEFFSFVAFRSNYTAEDRTAEFRRLSRHALAGDMGSAWGMARLVARGLASGKPLLTHMIRDECDALLGDSETLSKLRRERFDMLVADDFTPCNAILAEALDIPFVQQANWAPAPEIYGPLFQVPTNPSYIPARQLGFTDHMAFYQRLKNVIAHWVNVYGVDATEYQRLKVKYNINPHVNIVDSIQQARLWFFNTNYPIEFPRPLHPNTVLVPATVGSSRPIETLADDLAEFLDTAPLGVVIFSFGSHIESMSAQQGQMFADGLAMIPQRVLWQAKGDMSRVKIGTNTKIVKWIPLAQLMEHPKVKVLVTHGGVNCVNEAVWAGLPMVGIPLLFDMFDNIDRVVAHGYGVALNDITQVTSESLYNAISTVVNDPKYRVKVQRASAIMKDLAAGVCPAETIAHWILHVTKYGGDHLRPAIFDLNFVQRNLLDVYLVLLIAAAAIVGACVSLCNICCVRRGSRPRPKVD